MTEYVIVGREVDNTKHYLDPASGTIGTSDGPGLQPLNVEFIGRLMVDLSRRGKNGVTDDEITACENQIKHALEVKRPAGGSTAPVPNADAIWKATAVRIIFEERIEGPVEGNTRLLIVPADGTLEVTEQALDGLGNASGTMPALVYPLDSSLILAARREDIIQGVASFGDDPALQAALRQHVTKVLDDLIVQMGPAKAILSSPKRAFHRGVGIYATNMCR